MQPVLLKSFSSSVGYPALTEKVVLTFAGMERCSGSGEDIENTLTAVKLLSRRAEHADPSDEEEPGVRFTISQLIDAVSLSLDSDQAAVSRLLAILESEGWI
jgi:hypothetical protein